jgi:arsenate reductase
MDLVLAVCDQAAGEVCPAWPGKPVTAHWGVPDPAAVEGPETEKIRAFRYAYQALETRIKLFTALRLEALDRLALERKVGELGHLRILPSGEPEA